MFTWISLWLTRWESAFILRTTALVARGLTAMLPAPSRPAVSEQPMVGHQHNGEANAAPGLWMMAPRVTVAVWTAAGIVSLAHHVRLPRGAGR